VLAADVVRDGHEPWAGIPRRVELMSRAIDLQEDFLRRILRQRPLAEEPVRQVVDPIEVDVEELAQRGRVPLANSAQRLRGKPP
jgi:hypothetical protein